MFSWLASSQKTTPTLQIIFNAIDILQKKCTDKALELVTAKEDDAGLRAQHQKLSELLDGITSVRNRLGEDPSEDLLAVELLIFISGFYHKNKTDLNHFGNATKSMVSKGISALSYGATYVGGAALTGMSLGGGAVLFFGGSTFNKTVRNTLGFDSQLNDTCIQIQDLIQTLVEFIDDYNITSELQARLNEHFRSLEPREEINDGQQITINHKV